MLHRANHNTKRIAVTSMKLLHVPLSSCRVACLTTLWAFTMVIAMVPGALEAVQLDPLCSDVPAALDMGIQPPALPTISALPVGPFCVAGDTAALQDHVLNCAHPDILLRRGVYSPAGLAGNFLALPETRRLWAQVPGSVTLEFGISLRQHADSELHGLVIDIRDPENAVPIGPVVNGYLGAVVYWGTTATGIRIHDTEILGHDAVHVGILGGHADGTDIRRVGVEGFLRYGIRLNQRWSEVVNTQARITDVVVRRIGDPVWRASETYTPGTAEHGIWIGLPTQLGRAQVRDVYWTGIITGNCLRLGRNGLQCVGPPLDNVQMFDVDVDRVGMEEGLVVSGAGSGIGFERVSTNISVRRFCIGPDTEQGVHAEWNHSFGSDSARGLNIVTGVISSYRVGVFFGSGTQDSTLQSLRFLNSPSVPTEHWAAVGLNCNAWPATCNTITMSDLSYEAGMCCHEALGTYNSAACCAGPCDAGMCQF